MSEVEQQFPADAATLHLLAAACNINPDTGQTHLRDFLDMGSRVKSQTLIDGAEGEDAGDTPIYLVEYEEGFAPFSEHQVIKTLAEEVLRLRGEA